MDKRLLTLCVSLFTLFGPSCINTAFVTMNSSVATLGNNYHEVNCDYSILNEEIFESIEIYETVNGLEKQVAGFYAGMKHPMWYASVSNDIKRRAFLVQPGGPTSLQIYFINTVCDDEKSYICLLRFRTSQQERKVQRSKVNKVIVSGNYFTRAAFVTIIASNATYGNNPHQVQCDYKLGDNDRFLSLSMFQVVNGKDVRLAIFRANMKNPVWDLNVPKDIKERATLLQSEGYFSFSVFFYTTLCRDEKQYKCQLTFRHGKHIQDNRLSQTIMITVTDGCVEGAYVLMTSSVGVLGNYPHYVRCDSPLAAKENLLRLLMFEIVNEAKELIAEGYPFGAHWVSDKYKHRAVLLRPNGYTSLQVYFKNTVCSDAKFYQCELTYGTAAGYNNTIYSETIQVTIEG